MLIFHHISLRAAALTLTAVLLAALTTACGRRGQAGTMPDGGDTLTERASLLTIVDHGDFVAVTIADPWDSTAAPLQRLVLADSARLAGMTVPTGWTPVRVPLSNSLVFSSVHAGAITEMGAAGAIKGVCDAAYFKLKPIADGLRDGSVVDAGSSMSPSIEKILLMGPDAILRSPYQNSTGATLASTGVPVIEMADYMETTPLGRAEWIKLLGALYGKLDRATAIYDDVAGRYEAVKGLTAQAAKRPKVLTETANEGVWYVPGGHSYMARLIADAGGDYLWADDRSTGSLPLDYAAVYARAAEADVWLVKTYGHEVTLESMRQANPLNAKFKAMSTGGVYGCDTEASTLFEDFPFHPDLLLKEFNSIFTSTGTDSLRYYRQAR